MMAHARNFSPREVEAGGPGVQSHPQLHSEFEVSLDSMRAREEREEKGVREGGKGEREREEKEEGEEEGREMETQLCWIGPTQGLHMLALPL